MALRFDALGWVFKGLQGFGVLRPQGCDGFRVLGLASFRVFGP